MSLCDPGCQGCFIDSWKARWWCHRCHHDASRDAQVTNYVGEARMCKNCPRQFFVDVDGRRMET